MEVSPLDAKRESWGEGYAYQEHRSSNMHLRFGSENGDDVTCSLFVRESKYRVCFGLDVVDKDALFP